jgi:hypothetical protein
MFVIRERLYAHPVYASSANFLSSVNPVQSISASGALSNLYSATYWMNWTLVLRNGRDQIRFPVVTSIRYEASRPAHDQQSYIWRYIMNNHFEMADEEETHAMYWGGSRSFVWPLFLLLISDHDVIGSDTAYRTEQVAVTVH